MTTYAGVMSDARRRTADTTPEPRAKALARPASDAWRLEVARWNEDDRFAWRERAAIMLGDAALSVDDAEHAAYLDVSKRRTGAGG